MICQIVQAESVAPTLPLAGDAKVTEPGQYD